MMITRKLRARISTNFMCAAREEGKATGLIQIVSASRPSYSSEGGT